MPDGVDHWRGAGRELPSGTPQSEVLDALPAHIALLDAEGVILAVNEAWRRFARDNDLADQRHGVGQSYLAICDRSAAAGSEDSGRMASGIRAVLAGEVAEFSLDYPCHAPDEQRWFRAQVRRVTNPHATPGAVVMHMDITASQQAEATLHHALHLMRAAGKAARIGGWRIDLASGRVEWSDEVAAIHEEPPGHSPKSVDEGVGYYAAEWRELLRSSLEACATDGTPFDHELEITTRSGRRLWVRTVAEAVRDAQGTITHIQGAFQDISERKGAQAALAASETRFERIADALPLLIWTAEPDGTLDYANAAFYRYTGQSRETFPLHRFLELVVHPDDRGGQLLPDRRPAAERTVYSTDRRLLAADGSYRWHHVAAVPDRDASGAVVKWYGSSVDIHDRVLAEDHALELANRLQVTLNSISDSFIALDTEWRYTFVNDHGEQVLGRSRSELLGKVIWEEYPQLVGTPFHAAVREAMEHRRSAAVEYSATGLGRHFDISVYPADDGGVAVYFRDVTERAEARRKLAEEDLRFRAVARTVTDVVWDWDLARDRIWWSDGLTEVFGHPEGGAETDLEAWSRRVHPDDRQRVLASLDAALACDDEHWRAEYRFIHADGSVREVEDRGALIRNEEGKAVRFVGGIADITEHKRARAMVERQAALLDQARDAIVVRGLDDRIIYWNRGAERIYGWGADEVRGRSIETLLHEDAVEYRTVTATVLANGEWRGRMLQRRRDGSTLTVEGHWVLVTGTGTEDDDSTIMAISTDITEQLLLEEKLAQAQRLEAVGQLTGGIAHDFNNLLTVMLGNAELLVEELDGDGDLREVAGMIQTAGERAGELTRQLLAFARKQTLDPHVIDVNALVGGMDRMLRRTLGEQVEIELVRGAGLWSAEVDEAQLENALLNLCINARDAMAGGGKLTLETGNAQLDQDYAQHYDDLTPGQYVMIAVSDTGCGMDPQTAERAFDPFFTTKDVGRGSGLGLSMVYGFVKQSGGHVKIYSEVDEGTTIRLYLPRATADDAVAEQTSDAAESARGHGERILLVEDDELVRQHIAGQLEGLGYQVVVAADGREALAVLGQGTDFDLLFTDVVMPGGLSGRDLADAARELRPDLPVLFTSGYTDNAIVHHGRLDSGVQLLSKPYRQHELAAKVRRVLDWK